MSSAFKILPLKRSSDADDVRTGDANGSNLAAISLEIPDVKLIRVRAGANPGSESDLRDDELLAEIGVVVSFVQSNCSILVEAGTIRGLHFQKAPRTQAKLVYVVRGSIYFVAVDIRPGSPTFGRHVSANLSAEGGEKLFVPPGFANGFCTLEEDTEVAYKTSDYYSADHEVGIAFDDPELGIDWPLAGRKPVVSEKDRALPALRQSRQVTTQPVLEVRHPQPPTRVLVTGGAGFVGGALVRHLIANTTYTVLNLDKLTSAASPSSLDPVIDNDRYEFRAVDVCDARMLGSAFREFRPNSVIHLAAETRADRPIAESETFLRTNTVGTLRLLQAASAYFEGLDTSDRDRFRFQHVSTSEVFGIEHATNPASLNIPLDRPLSPYTASKAAADHVVRAWGHTFGLPVLVTCCTNIFGPYQTLEEFVPTTIVDALVGHKLTDLIQTDRIRDWLFVDDFAELLLAVVERGQVGNTYLVGGNARRSNRQVVTAVADLVEEFTGPLPDGRSRRNLIAEATDAPAEDYRYLLAEQSRLENALGWRPANTFESGLRKTVFWYLENQGWWGGPLQPLGIDEHQLRSVAPQAASS